MLKIEPHKIHPDREVIVWYEGGERQAAVYVDPVKGLTVMVELGVKIEVLRRCTDPLSFEKIL